MDITASMRIKLTLSQQEASVLKKLMRRLDSNGVISKSEFSLCEKELAKEIHDTLNHLI